MQYSEPGALYAQQYAHQQYAQAQHPGDAGNLHHPSNTEAALAAARSEIASLKAENASLKAEIQSLRSAPAVPSRQQLPPSHFYPPSPGYYGYAAPPSFPAYSATQPGWSMGAPAAQGLPRPLPSLALNAENRRGPKGANLALFCIPNSYVDQQVFDLVAPFGKVVFCSVAIHRETGSSRGYAFVSFETIEEAEKAIAGLHSRVVEGRALRCEVARSDREGGPGGGGRAF